MSVSKEFRDRFEGELRHIDIENEPFIVFFTGVPFSGKSTVAKALQHRYNMVRIENDRVRDLSNRFEETLDIYGFVTNFLKNFPYPNQRIVQDSSIDRMHPEIIPYCKENKIPYYIISMPVPSDYEKRIREKGKTDVSKEKFIRDHEEAEKQLDIDFKFDEDGGMRELLRELDQKFKEIEER